MKKIFVLAMILCFLVPIAHAGILYTNTKVPVTATSAGRGVRVGTSISTTFLWLFTVGDASIDTAARKANIANISHVDSKEFAILGTPCMAFYGTKTTEVYGR